MAIEPRAPGLVGSVLDNLAPRITGPLDPHTFTNSRAILDAVAAIETREGCEPYLYRDEHGQLALTVKLR